MAEIKQRYIKKQREIKNISTTPNFPQIIKIDTCNICNYSCLFCPQAKQINKKGVIDKELCLRIIRDAKSAGAEELCLSMTGEPLLNFDLEIFITEAKKIGYRYIFLNTNGYLLDEERSKSLLEAGIDSIKISINAYRDSYKLVHGIEGFDKVKNNIINFDNIRKMKGYKCSLSASFVAVRQTLCEAKLVKSVLEPFLDDFLIMYANSRGGSVDEFQEKLYIGNDEYSFAYPCSQLFNNAYVTAEGYLIICCQDFENLTVVADLNKESITEAWNNDKFVAFRKRYLEKDLNGTLCDNCINNKNEKVIPLTKELAFYQESKKRIDNLQKRIKIISGK